MFVYFAAEVHAHEKITRVRVAELVTVDDVALPLKQPVGHGADDTELVRADKFQDVLVTALQGSAGVESSGFAKGRVA